MQREECVTGKNEWTSTVRRAGCCLPGELPCWGKHALVLARKEQKQVLICVFVRGWGRKHVGTRRPEFQKGANINKRHFLLPQVNNKLQTHDWLPTNIVNVRHKLHTMAERLDTVDCRRHRRRWLKQSSKGSRNWISLHKVDGPSAQLSSTAAWGWAKQ